MRPTKKSLAAQGIFLLAFLFLMTSSVNADSGELYTYSAHLDQVLVQPGQFVHQGEPIGIVGSTGYVKSKETNKHLHFAVRNLPPSDESCWDSSCWLNPDDYLGTNGWLASPVPGENRCGAAFGELNPQGGQAFHNAADIACGLGGSQVLAVADGYVVYADWWPSSSQSNHEVGHGLTVVIHHTNEEAEVVKEVRPESTSPSNTEEVVDSVVDTVNTVVELVNPEASSIDSTDPVETTPDYVNQPTAKKFPWSKLLTIIGLATACLVFRSWGISYRIQACVAGFILVGYSLALPSFNNWLASPFSTNIPFQIVDFYGDVRHVAEGQTAQIYAVPRGTKVRSVVPGEVLESSQLFAPQGNQVWIKVGNGLYVQYAGLDQIKVKSGQKIRQGQIIGTSTEKFRLGVSSKSPELFNQINDRSYGWIDPEKFLGQTILSGTRQQDFTSLQWGSILLIFGLFWPSNYLKRLVKRLQLDLVAPYGSDWFYARARLLVIFLAVLAAALIIGSPWLKWISFAPIVVSVIYFLDRASVRKRLKNRQKINLWWSFMIHSILSFVWVTWVVFLLLGGLISPDITYAANIDYQLTDLPRVVTPPLSPREVSQTVPQEPESDSNDNLPSPEVLIPEEPASDNTASDNTEPDNSPPRSSSVSSELPEFSITYWNGSKTRFWIDPEVWNAAVAAWKKYPDCDPRLNVAVAHSESPGYTNHANENSATAAGRWQFIRSTWKSIWKNSESIPERTDDFAAAEAACLYMINNGMTESINSSEAAFVSDFAEEPPVWNMYPPQAEYVWRAYHQLVDRLPLP